MDEPDSNLDAEGTLALAGAVRDLKARGGAAVIVAHRQGAFAQCDAVYLMENGRPVPARARPRAAPARQGQGQGPAGGAQRVPARQPARAPAVARPPVRDKQIARAIERVVGARAQAAVDDGTEALADPGTSAVGTAPAQGAGR